MRIAFTHNLQVLQGEDEAEFDSPATIGAVADALRGLGHEVHVVEASGPVAPLVGRLELLKPDLVFNTAEGRAGRAREAALPSLLEQLHIPFTGADAWACTVTLDKRMTKLVVEKLGLKTPRWAFVERADDGWPDDLVFPVVVKPNYEGSSKGVGAGSVAHDAADLRDVVTRQLEAWPSGVLIEEYVDGDDVIVAFLEAAPGVEHGILPPVRAVWSLPPDAARVRLLDFAAKHGADPRVRYESTGLRSEVVEALKTAGARVARAFGLRDVARLDFRVTPAGEVVFLEANALPSLDPRTALYRAAEAAGIKEVGALLACVLASASARWGLRSVAPTPERRSGIRVGLVFNLKRVMPRVTGENDEEAEFDSPTTVQALQAAIATHGHEVVPMEATPDLLQKITTADVDMVFNIAEGIRGRARESLVPSILEMLDIPYTGSDPVTLALTLDKGLAKRIVRQAGVFTPEWVVMTTGREKLPPEMTFPMICKPVAEGSSKGVSNASVVHSDDELRRTVREILERYRQGVLVEQFLPGREFTVGVLGDRRPHVLPPMEIVFQKKDEDFPIYTFAHKQDWTDEVQYVCPAKTDDRLGRELVRAARRAFTALDCRDVARIDLRLDAAGRVNFIECNPLPGLTPEWSDLCIIAKAAGLDYNSLVGEIMAPALRRVKQRRRDAASSSERRST